MRVVSLLPAATEICFALGIEPVGVSSECDYPPAARSIPAVERARIDETADSAAISEQVAAAEEDGGLYEIDAELLADLEPDLVITQGVCDVCAVDRVAVAAVIDDLGLETEILTTDPHSLSDLYEETRRIGRATDREGAAIDLVSAWRNRIATLREQTSALETPSVAVLDWMEPVMVAGHWVPDLVEAAGGTYPLAAVGERSRPREWSEIRGTNPDVLVAAPCGYQLEQTLQARRELADRPGWDELTAVRERRVYALDGRDFVNRPGPRLIDTAEHLAGLLHPDAFPQPPGDVARRLEQ
ncbi:cobalamin-binding protein [Halapricum desulfuricans]|uniref:ABC-type Fe3+-hydroxamate transport system, periplasmic component n=1 Tax=Halapricum desulfuricans TaxID=2841257 RepID=A0A897N8T9_9EURY|nr:cobalamin-binding protein [Halapricum desulfuricans]QSG06796.1 ABC-type Fe3+-hydroxamate transport system, periplasmic component [Halapricum desulfuricans]